MTRSIHTPGAVVQVLGLDRLDIPLLFAVALVSLFGLAVLYSASGSDLQVVIRQILRLGMGGLALLFLARLSLNQFQGWAHWAYLLSLGLLILVWVLGEGRGAQRWLDLGIVRFQPSELLKLTVPLMVAWTLQHMIQPVGWRGLLVSGIIIGIPVVLIARQPDLGTALLVGSSGLFVLFLAGLRWQIIIAFAALVGGAAPLVWKYLMHDYQRSRVLTFIDPDSDPLGRGWNIIQSKIAIGSGGLNGKGWLNGTQAQLEFLPERSTDFILAVLAEEFGLVGVLILLCLYLFIVARCLYIAAMARDTFARLFAGAIGLTFFVYVFVNFGMVSGLLPVVGVPLPLVSHGGTSAVTLLAGFGIVMAIGAHQPLLRAR